MSALPKRIPQPIRVQDLEKISQGPSVLPNFVDARPKVIRPPPGFLPNINVGVTSSHHVKTFIDFSILHLLYTP